MAAPLPFELPEKLVEIAAALRTQADALRRVAGVYADAIGRGGSIHVYANGHSRIAVEEMCVRMGALSGFHPLLQAGLVTFTDVVGPNGIRLNQALEKVEGLGEQLLEEFEAGPDEPLLVVSATGQTRVAVDIALAWRRRYPDHPLVAIASRRQASQSPPKHSSGQTLWHVVQGCPRGHFLDNGMPVGDLSVRIEGKTGAYGLCPLSTLGAIGLVQSLNELTVRELDRRGIRHPVLQNMHLGDTRESYDAWLRDQRRRYARALAGAGT